MGFWFFRSSPCVLCELCVSVVETSSSAGYSQMVTDVHQKAQSARRTHRGFYYYITHSIQRGTKNIVRTELAPTSPLCISPMRRATQACERAGAGRRQWCSNPMSLSSWPKSPRQRPGLLGRSGSWRRAAPGRWSQNVHIIHAGV